MSGTTRFDYGSRITTSKGACEFRRSTIILLGALLGTAAGLGICLVPFLVPRPEVGDFLFFGVMGLPIVISGIVGLPRLMRMFIRVTDRAVEFSYGRRRGEIELAQIARVYTAPPFLFVVQKTNGEKVLLPLYFERQHALIALISERALMAGKGVIGLKQ